MTTREVSYSGAPLYPNCTMNLEVEGWETKGDIDLFLKFVS